MNEYITNMQQQQQKISNQENFLSACTSTLGLVYNEFGYNEYPTTTNKISLH